MRIRPLARKRFTENGADATPGASPEAFAEFQKKEISKWTKVVRDAGIKSQ